MADGCIHDIFLINPIEQINFVQKNVKIILKNGEALHGTIYTIDPVSQSVVLACQRNDSNGVSIKIIMKHSIKSMEVLSEMPSATVIPLNKIFRIDQIDSSLKYQQNQVKNWLKKNLIPVVVNGDILQIENLEIHPPYGPNQCFSSNPIVLSRIQNLLMLMVQENH